MPAHALAKRIADICQVIINLGKYDVQYIDFFHVFTFFAL